MCLTVSTYVQKYWKCRGRRSEIRKKKKTSFQVSKKTIKTLMRQIQLGTVWTNFSLWLLFVCSPGVALSLSLMREAGCLIETWQLHTVVCMCVYWQLQIAVKRTERTVYSLFSLKHRQHPSPVTERRGREGERVRGGSGEWQVKEWS